MIWFALHTKPGREAQAYRDLDRQGYAVFSPQEIVTAARRNAKGELVTSKRKTALCKGYVFIGEQPFPACRWIIGVLQFDGKPVAIGEHELLPLRVLHDTERKINAPKRAIVLNEVVRVAVGRMAGITGKAVLLDGARVVIETEMFGSKRTVTVGKDSLEAA